MTAPDKQYTFDVFNEKWRRARTWAKATEASYRKWYLTRYGYGTLENLATFLADKRLVLEAGCGQARDSKMFAELDPVVHIVAMDQSLEALAVAEENLAGFENCQVVQGDITAFTWPMPFDFISCDQVMHHTPDPAATLRHLYSHLSLGGVLNFFVCRKKGPERDLVDDKIMEWAKTVSYDDLWAFAVKATKLGKALYELGIKDVQLGDETFPDVQRLVHNRLFRCWYDPNIDFELSVSSNFDWFSGNPRFNAEEVRAMIATLPADSYQVTRFYEDDPSISVSLTRIR